MIMRTNPLFLLALSLMISLFAIACSDDSDPAPTDGDVTDGDVTDGDTTDGDTDLAEITEEDADVVTEEDTVAEEDVVVEEDVVAEEDVVTEEDVVVEEEAEADIPVNPFWSGDDFESGDLSQWSTAGDEFEAIVDSATAANGSTYSAQITRAEANGHSQGLVKEFDEYQPCGLSFWLYTTDCAADAGYRGYFILSQPQENDEYAGDIAFFFISEAGLAVNDGSGPQILDVCTPQKWYHISALMDWDAKTMDITVDNELKASDVSFKDTNVTAASKLELYNWKELSVARWDEIQLWYTCE